MITISLCMIVKNEEEVLARCLDSVRGVADEIVVVDTGSTDRTREIAAVYTDKVLHFTWEDDFSAARNFSFRQATQEYILWLDADDVLLEADREKLIALKSTLSPSVGVVMMKYHAGEDEEGGVTLSYYRERLLRRDMDFTWEDPVHEAITPRGKIVYADVAITHRRKPGAGRGRNLAIYRKMIAAGRRLTPRQQFYYARELYYAGEYREALEGFTAFLDGGEGWQENCISACQDMAVCCHALGLEREELASLTRSFAYDEPRAELCCDIGHYFFRRACWKQAVFWYQVAASRPLDERDGGFKLPDCYGYIPYLQICVCYDRLGDTAAAEHYNELAALCKPDDAAVAFNRDYFKRKREEEKHV